MPRKFTDSEKHAMVHFCYENLDMSRMEAIQAFKYQEQASLRMDLAKSILNGFLAGGWQSTCPISNEMLVTRSFDLADEMLNQENENAAR